MRRILQHLGRYRRDSIICILMTALEVVMEVLLPFITARIIDDGLSESNMPVVYRLRNYHDDYGVSESSVRCPGGKICCQRVGGALCESERGDLRQYSDFFFFEHR